VAILPWLATGTIWTTSSVNAESLS
jgi:hypothetical protein